MPLVYAGQATLAWDANPDPAVAGYMVYSGEASGTYTSKHAYPVKPHTYYM